MKIMPTRYACDSCCGRRYHPGNLAVSLYQMVQGRHATKTADQKHLNLLPIPSLHYVSDHPGIFRIGPKSNIPIALTCVKEADLAVAKTNGAHQQTVHSPLPLRCAEETAAV